MAENEVRRIAVLIDADNTSLGCLEDVLMELSIRGRIIVKRAYGNWKKEELKNWPEEINKLAIRAVQQFDYVAGKNATDIALVIDALDLLYTDNYDAFALVSSDSDYTPLAIRLHESGAYVYGVGRSNTSKSFVNACDEFIILENLLRTSHRNRSSRNAKRAGDGRSASQERPVEVAAKTEQRPAAKAAETAQKPETAENANARAVENATAKSVTAETANAHAAEKHTNEGEGRSRDAGRTEGVKPENRTSEFPKADGHLPENGNDFADGPEEDPKPEVSEEELAELHALLRKIWEDNQNEDGFVFNSLAGILLRRIKPDFDPRTYGEKRLSDLLYRYPDRYEIVASEIGHKGYRCID